MKLDQKSSMEDWYNEEITHLKQQAEGHEDLKKTLETERHMETSKLTRQVNWSLILSIQMLITTAVDGILIFFLIFFFSFIF